MFGHCEPDCSGAVAGDKVPDPTDCRNYYLCLGPDDPSSAPISCADDDPHKPYFDASEKRCSDRDSHCVTLCVPPVCQLSCRETNDYIADPDNCNVFYICLPNGLSAAQYCPPEAPFFDSSRQRCSADSHECCDACIVYCPAANIEIPDPFDCTSFYVCMEVGPVDAEENYHLSCANGENYDATWGLCSPEVDCKILCGGREDPAFSVSVLYDI